MTFFNFRYRLWQKVWYVWTEFVKVSRCKRRKSDLAHKMASRRLLSQVWKGWSQYIVVRREKKQLEVQVEQWTVLRMNNCSSWRFRREVLFFILVH